MSSQNIFFETCGGSVLDRGGVPAGFLWVNGDLNWALWLVVIHRAMFGAHGVPKQCASPFLVLGNMMGLMRKIIYTRRIRADPQPAFQGAWGVYRVAVCGFLCTCGAIGVFSHAHALA